MKHVRAPLAGFENVPIIEGTLTEINPRNAAHPTRRFPLRYLRYWFVRHVLADLHAELGRPLRVLEVGIGGGKMLAFMGGERIERDRYALPDMIERWDALDVHARPGALKRYSYSTFRQADVEAPFEPPASDYDAVVVLHVLEHLFAPEAAMRRLLRVTRPGGLLVGGSPTMPDFMARVHVRQLRRKYSDQMEDVRAHRHLSVITSKRIRRFAKAEGLSTDLLSGAFLLRASANPLEDHPWWVRANLAWGALFPPLGGEIYFALRTH